MSAPVEPPTVAVSGVAERAVAPDSFTLSASIEVRAASSPAAHHLLAARAQELDAAIAALGGVEAEPGPLSGWSDGARRNPMWVAQRSTQVTCRVLERAAEVAGALGSVADVRVDGPTWSIDKDNPAWHELQAEAVHAARARAERYAAALDGTLGSLVELSDVGTGWRGASAVRAAAGEMAFAKGGQPGLESLDLSPQPVSLSASVNARWYLVLPN